MKAQPATLHPQPAIHLHIERLVVEGFTASGAELQKFSAQLARDLEQRLVHAEFAPQHSSARARAAAPAVALPAAGLNAGAVRSVAAAVVSGLSLVVKGDAAFPSAIRPKV